MRRFSITDSNSAIVTYPFCGNMFCNINFLISFISSSGSGGYDAETVDASASEIQETTEKNPQPQNTRFKVVSSKDKISPQQVHENDLSPCVGFNPRT